MSEEILKYSSPAYWQEKITKDQKAPGRDAFLGEVGRADELLTNDLELGLNDNDWQYKRSTWMKAFQSVSGRMLYGKMNAKVEGVEDEDMDIAEMYEAGINWEFNQPRGLHQKTGRKEVRSVGEDWISYGIGAMNTYWDSTQRSRENPTGSIINESVMATELILDSDVERFVDLNRISRKFQKGKTEVEAMYPHLNPDKIPHDDGKVWLFDTQFRSPKRVKAKLSTAEMREIAETDSPHFFEEDRDRVESLYRKKHKGAKRADSTKAWDALKGDSWIQPMVYSFQFLSDQELERGNGMQDPKYLTINQEARYVGRDFSYTLVPFLFQPKRVYPAGAAKFIYGDQVYEALLMTLYMAMIKELNNTGIGVNLDAIVGTNDAEKMEEIKRFMKEINYPLPLKNIQDVNQALSQLRQNPPPRDMLVAADRASYTGDDFFQTHPGQTGQTPSAGTPFRSMALAQQAGASIMAHMVDSMTNFIETVHRKTGTLIYKYMPKDKVVRLTRTTGEKKKVMLVKSKMEKYDPQDIDILVSIDTQTEGEKQQEKEQAYNLYDRGLSAPEDFMDDLGIRNASERLKKLQDYGRGQLVVAAEKSIPGLKDSINEAIQTHQQEKEIRNGQ